MGWGLRLVLEHEAIGPVIDSRDDARQCLGRENRNFLRRFDMRKAKNLAFNRQHDFDVTISSNSSDQRHQTTHALRHRCWATNVNMTLIGDRPRKTQIAVKHQSNQLTVRLPLEGFKDTCGHGTHDVAEIGSKHIICEMTIHQVSLTRRIEDGVELEALVAKAMPQIDALDLKFVVDGSRRRAESRSQDATQRPFDW